MVGAANTLFGYGVIFSCMYLLDMEPILSNIVGYGIGLVASYLLHRTYTFRHSHQPIGFNRIVRFAVVFIIAYTSNLFVLMLLVNRMRLHVALSQVLAGVVYIAITFLMNKYYVFKIEEVRLSGD